MPNNITVQVANPQAIRLTVTAELALSEWCEILKLRTGPSPINYYGPLWDLLNTIEKAIEAVTQRDKVDFNCELVRNPDKEGARK